MWADPNFGNYAIHTYGAHFAEVGVGSQMGQRRSSRDLPGTSKFWSAYPNIAGMQASGLNTGC